MTLSHSEETQLWSEYLQVVNIFWQILEFDSLLWRTNKTLSAKKYLNQMYNFNEPEITFQLHVIDSLVVPQ